MLPFLPVCSGEAYADEVDAPLVLSEAVQSQLDSAASVQTVPGQVIVTYEKDATAKQKRKAAGALSAAGAEKRTEVSGASGGEGASYLASLEDDCEVGSVVAELNDLPGVARAQRNFRYTISASAKAALPNDPYINSQYALNSWTSKNGKGANVKAAWKRAQKSNSWKEGSAEVAVLDTGINKDHDDLADNIDTDNMAAVTDYGLNIVYGNGDEAEDEVGHGTHVAGIISARAGNGIGVAGVSYNAKILPIKVYYYDSDSGEYVSDSIRMVQAYRYLEYLKKRGKLKGLHVINISAGGYLGSGSDWQDEYLEQHIKTMLNKYNTLTVCAGGNGVDGKAVRKKCLPSDFKECIAVTALDRKGNNAVYSDYNKYKDISAPGARVLSTTSDGRYGYMTGTSMAAPVVSGIVALAWQANPKAKASKVRKAIISSAHPLSKKGTHYHSKQKTGSAGAIDADRVVKAVLGKKS